LCPICRARIEEEKPRRGGDVEMANTMLNSQDEWGVLRSICFKLLLYTLDNTKVNKGLFL